MSFGSEKKVSKYACLSEAKASHSQRMWAEVSSSVPHLLHNGLSDSPYWVKMSHCQILKFVFACRLQVCDHTLLFVFKWYSENSTCRQNDWPVGLETVSYGWRFGIMITVIYAATFPSNILCSGWIKLCFLNTITHPCWSKVWSRRLSAWDTNCNIP